jgi:hypothetical protein
MVGLKRRIELLAALPLDRLDALSQQAELRKLSGIAS